MGNFGERMRELSERVGEGMLRGGVEVDQPYAAPIERGYWESGPLAGVRNQPRHGGETHALENSLERGRAEYLQRLADHALKPHGLQGAMADNVEDLSGQYHDNAPREFGDLRNSPHPTVTDDGREVYNRAPVRARLTEGALREKSRRSRLGEGPSRARERK